MKKMQSVALALCCLTLVVLICGASPGFAQNVTASITGTITDPSGAPIAGATVTARDVDRGVSWSAQTNDAGIYNILRIAVGSYSVKVEAKGFETAVYPTFALVLNQIARVDVAMRVGAVTSTVEVVGVAPLLQTQSTEISTLIDSTTDTNLPLGSRNYLQLALLSPGATQPNPQTMRQGQVMSGAGRPYINGNREQSDNDQLDGIENNENSNNEVGYTPSIDAVQEFNIITQNAPAEFGNFSGGIINTTLKAGSNSFHGDAFEFLRNDKLNANSWANDIVDAPKDKMRWNMFGGTIGGPIIKNKLFFFGDYQGQRYDFPSSTQSSSVLTSAERSGDFGAICGAGFDANGICLDRSATSTGGTAIIDQLCDPRNPCVYGNAGNIVSGTPIPNNNIATYTVNGGLPESTVATALFASSHYPTANVSTGSAQATALGQAPNYQSVYNDAINNNQYDVRIDYDISEKDRVFGHYSHMSLQNPYDYTYALIGSPGMPSTEPVKNVGGEWTHSINTNVLNDLRIGYNEVNFNQSGTNASTSLGNFAAGLGINGGNAYAAGMPNLSFTGAANFNIGSAGLVQEFDSKAYQFSENIVVTHGRHTFKFGGQLQRYNLQNEYSGNAGLLGTMAIGTQTGFSGADFYLGLLENAQRGVPALSFDRISSTPALYAQDDWKITSTLTLNLGVRFEDHLPFYEQNDKWVNFGLFSGQILPAGKDYGNSNTFYANYLGKADYQPRIGFAWSPERFHGKLVTRASYTVSTYMEGGGVGEQPTANPPYSLGGSSVGAGSIANGFGALSTPCTVIQDSCYTGINIFLINPHLMPEITQQWNLTLQYQLNNSTTFQAGYVGQHSTHLLNLMDYSQYDMLSPAQYTASGDYISGPVLSPGPYLAGNADLKASFNPSSSTYARGGDSNGTASYNALQMVLQKKMSNGLQAQVAYTFSKCMSNSGGFYGSWGGQASNGVIGWQNLYDPKADWGPCFFDITHTLTGYAVYELPVGKGRKYGSNMNSIVNGVIGGWNLSPILSWHSGYAMTQATAWFDSGYTGGLGAYYENERPDCVATIQYTDKAIAGVPGIQWFSPSSFLTPQPGTFGNCPVGDVRGPGYFDLDLGIQKDFPIGEHKRLEFRTEMLNAFNNVIFNAPTNACGSYGVALGSNAPASSLGCSSSMGMITGSQGERNIQFALKFYF
jgi:hypothetical protein